MMTIQAVNKTKSGKILSNWNVQTEHLRPVEINDEALVGFSKVPAWARITTWHKERKAGVFHGSGARVTEPNRSLTSQVVPKELKPGSGLWPSPGYRTCPSSTSGSGWLPSVKYHQSHPQSGTDAETPVHPRGRNTDSCKDAADPSQPLIDPSG